MAEGDDFTFCRIENPVVDVGARKVVDNGNGVQRSADIWKISNSSQNQRNIGSLSFNVIDASPPKEVDQRPKLADPVVAGTSRKSSPQMSAPARKFTPRAAVPFEKGYSQMDWVKLTRTHPDLADLKGQSNKRLIPMSEVKQHQSESSMWTVLKGRVYNITSYMKFHPGGVEKLKRAVGKDCTALFNKNHPWVNADFLLEKCLVGVLDDGK